MELLHLKNLQELCIRNYCAYQESSIKMEGVPLVSQISSLRKLKICKISSSLSSVENGQGTSDVAQQSRQAGGIRIKM